MSGSAASLAPDLAEEPQGLTADPIVNEAIRRFKRCSEWESTARSRFIADLKFANGDSHNGYQWPDSVKRSREVESKPCLTLNIVRQHNLQITNEGKINKNGVRVVASGNGATAEAAKIWDACVNRIQYISQADQVYSVAREFQVSGGMGWWRIVTDYVADDTFDMDIFLRPINDPLSVYMDPDIQQKNGSDALFAFVFDEVPREEFREAYPEYMDLAGLQPLGAGTGDDGWVGKTHVRVCEYFRKTPKKEKLLSFIDPDSGLRKTVRADKLPQKVRQAVQGDRLTFSREIEFFEVEWFLIVGEEIIDRTIWPGKYIPLVRVPGEESVIDGILDRKGHTRAMLDGQRMYNYNASAQVSHVALQTSTPWTGAAAAIEGYETLWNNANTAAVSILPFNHVDDDGNPIPVQALPRRIDAPASSQAFAMGMETAFNQLMMVSGQWQNQMGMMGNERTGEAIKRRQDQGDVATFHFKDNFDMALLFTGMQFLDLMPKVYNTRRVLQIQADAGLEYELEIDPAAKQAYVQRQDHQGNVVSRIFNPAVGRYEVRSGTGALGATRRQETIEALTLILTQAPGLTGIIGDLLLGSMDFDKADEAAARLRRMVPPVAMGQGPSQTEQQQQQQIMQLTAALQKSLQTLGKEQLRLTGKDQMRDIDAYKAETDRMNVLADAKALDPQMMQQTIEQLVRDAAHTHLLPLLAANAKDMAEDPDTGGASPEDGEASAGASALDAAASPMPGAKRAPDGEWYISDPTRRGRYLRIAPLAQERARPGIIGGV